jgi:MerR family transcriptional regulator, thiopeptide resistance regulator
MTQTIGAVARLAGISIRTLHHYDEIGLLSPGGRSEAGYRLYEAADLERLQQILLLRELGFGLDEIARVLDDPAYDRGTALHQQRDQLERNRARLDRLIAAVDQAITASQEGRTMTPEESLEVFGDFDPSEYEDEAKERWGDTDAYKESARRTKSYTKADWQRIGAESEEINQAFIALMDAGVPATSTQAREVAERHRGHITKWFYPCSPEIHASLGAMYAADPRFTKNIDKARDGLAKYMSEAIAALWG